MFSKQIDDRQLRVEFVAFLPDLKRVLRAKFRRLHPEARSERVSEAIAFAFGTWLTARRRGRDVNVYSLSHFAALAVSAGRRFAGGSWTNTRFAVGKRTRNASWAVSLDPQRRFADWLLEDRHCRWPVLDRVAFKLDWATFVSGQTHRTRRIIALLSQGYRRSEAAHLLGISRPCVTQRMCRAHAEWERFQDEPLYRGRHRSAA